MITLRILHILTGIFWAGTMFFMVSFLMPAMKDVGPQGAPLAAALGKRRLFIWMPVLAILAIVSGFALYGMRMGGGGDWARGREAMALGLGGVTAVIAFIIGMTVTRPAMTRIEAIGAKMATASPTEKDALVAEMNKLRTRSMMGSRAIATLLLVTVVTMAIAQYLV